jgi:NAD(P)-dependent dehydrogenase (short-subunit alcohol dehydrogenase family)
MNDSWNNKVVLVTGATGKLGKVMCEGLLSAGCRVIGTYYTGMDRSLKIEYIPLNITDSHSIDLFVESLSKKSIKIDWVVHNARSSDSLSINKEGWPTPENFVKELAMAITGPTYLTEKLLTLSPLKQIIFISSIYGLVVPNFNIYSEIGDIPAIQYGVGKAAQLHLVKELAIRLSKYPTRVNALVFGGVSGKASDEFNSKYSENCPQHRMLDNEDVLNGLLMALDPRQKSVTGQVFVVDGGWTLW